MQSSTINTKRTSVQTAKGNPVVSLLIVLFLLIAVAGTVWQTSPPAPVAATAPPTEFSSERAMEHLKVIAAEPHPSGSEAHGKVRDYLVEQIKALGLEPEIQSTTAYRQPDVVYFDRAGHVDNVLVRIKGTEAGGKAALLSAHYDSTANSNGAAKNGAAVASLLETMRALKAGQPLKNDVIFLFSDGLEAFMMGSQAFVTEHPWAKDVGIALNFESRGSAGPVMLAETSDQNGWMMSQFAKAAPHPMANSLLDQLVRDMPDKNLDTVVYGESLDAPRMSFLLADEMENYRNGNDTIANLDERTVQHQGSYALALAKQFGNADLTQTKSANDSFFNFGSLFVKYPLSWVLPISLLAAVVSLGVIGYGLRRKELKISGVLIGLLAFLLMIAAAAGIVTVAKMGVMAVVDYISFYNHDEIYHIGFIGLAIATALTVFGLFAKRFHAADLTAGAILLWTIANLATAFLMPVGNYLFAWPLLFSSIGLGIWLSMRTELSGKALLIFGAFALPVLVLGTQMAYILSIMLNHDTPAAIAAVIVLIIGLILPLFKAITVRAWIAPSASGVLGLGFLLAAVLMPAYSAEQPKPNELYYGMLADENKAVWATRDGSAQFDEYIGRFMNGAQNAEFSRFTPVSSEVSFLQTEAPVVSSLKPADVEVVTDVTTGDVRNLHLRLKAQGEPIQMTLNMSSDLPLKTAKLDGKSITNRDPVNTRWEIIYASVPKDGIDLEFELQKGQELKLNAIVVDDGLPAELNAERPADMVATYYSDLTYVSKQFTF